MIMHMSTASATLCTIHYPHWGALYLPTKIQKKEEVGYIMQPMCGIWVRQWNTTGVSTCIVNTQDLKELLTRYFSSTCTSPPQF